MGRTVIVYEFLSLFTASSFNCLLAVGCFSIYLSLSLSLKRNASLLLVALHRNSLPPERRHLDPKH